jgi:predicted Zn-dependent protease
VAVIGMHATWVRGHGTYHELIEELDRQIATLPDDGALYLRRAFLHLEHGEWKASLADVDRADRCKTDGLDVDLIRGRALAAGGRFNEAVTVLDGFLSAHPGHPVGLMQRARVRGELGQTAQAADDFALGMRGVVAPEPDQVFELASFLCKAGRKDEAIEAIDAALKRMRGIQSLVDRAVEIEMGLGRHDAALRRMDEAVRSAKVKEPLMAKRAALLARAGRVQESVAAWKELRERITAMPPLERDSHAMSRIIEQACHALAALTTIAGE